MPVIPLVSREASYSREAGRRPSLSKEEQEEAEESFTVYCKPVEIYNILQRRSMKNPLFLQRCLHYKIQEKNKNRVQISISINGASGHGVQTSLFPSYIVLARPVSTSNGEALCSSSFRFKRACKLTAMCSTQAKFILPEINKLSAEVKSGSLVMLLVSCGDTSNLKEIDLTMDCMFSPSIEAYCWLGKIPIDFLHLSWEKSPNPDLEGKFEMMSTVSVQPCYMKLKCLDKEKCISFKVPCNSEAASILQHVPVIITAEELGAKDKSAYEKNVPADLLPPDVRLRKGNVVFNMKYYHNMLQKTEVTEDFTCAFCLIPCTSFKGLQLHLTSSHDHFLYESWDNGDYQVVIVTTKPIEYTPENLFDMQDPKKEQFFFCHKPLRSRSKNQNTSHMGPHALISNMPEPLSDLRGARSAAGITYTRSASPAPSVPESCIVPTFCPQAQCRKVSLERSNPRSQSLLEKRGFFHSQNAQPMTLGEVFAEEDSEDEDDDFVADVEDKMLLDDFVDVAPHEKQLMHLWNSFTRKQRVLAEGHVPWACEAFSNAHGKDLVQTPQLDLGWRVLLVKLWDQRLIDSKTFVNCQKIVDNYRHQKKSRVTD